MDEFLAAERAANGQGQGPPRSVAVRGEVTVLYFTGQPII